MRRLGVLTAVLCLLAVPSGSAATSRSAAGVFSGFAFDACSAPSSASLAAWAASPYRGLGIYIGGANRACKQTNLTASWVQSTLASGWSLLPLYVGLQAPCVSQSGLAKLSTNVATAANQGRAAADDAAANASSLGLPAGSPVWFDMEGYKLGNAACTQAVQSFVGAWTNELHARGLVAGVYGSAASTMRDVAAIGNGKPDLAWIANWNGNQSVFGDQYVPDTEWASHQRVHQYKGGHKETYGGVTINIDSNVVDSAVVGGSVSPVPPPPPPPSVGQVNSGDGLSTATWPTGAFTTAVVVTLTPMATPPVADGYGVQLTAVEADNQAPIDGFGAPVTVHILKLPAGLVPAFSSDGTNWTPVPQLTSAGLQGQTLTGYTVDPDGTVEFQTLVSGYFGLIADTTPPNAPTVNGRLLPSGLYLSWQPASDAGGVASYSVLRNGLPIQTLTPKARRAIVRTPGVGTQTVYRVAATDVAGNAGKMSRAVVVLRKSRPAKLPRAIPQWAYGLLSFQRHQGARPKLAPKRPPAWYWTWAAWRAMPYRLR
ncbi:MAG TPA: DUF1906 domain-containing protein [Gaiellaceae bacterium]|nr:DUF1906 domain-containing protein [Gaiellaceae bacterium]